MQKSGAGKCQAQGKRIDRVIADHTQAERQRAEQRISEQCSTLALRAVGEYQSGALLSAQMTLQCKVLGAKKGRANWAAAARSGRTIARRR
jgi:hypothetical protein